MWFFVFQAVEGLSADQWSMQPEKDNNDTNEKVLALTFVQMIGKET